MPEDEDPLPSDARRAWASSSDASNCAMVAFHVRAMLDFFFIYFWSHLPVLRPLDSRRMKGKRIRSF